MLEMFNRNYGDGLTDHTGDGLTDYAGDQQTMLEINRPCWRLTDHAGD